MDFNNLFSIEYADKVTKLQLSETEKIEIKNIYKRVKRMELVETCHNCFTDAYFALLNQYRADKKKFNALYYSEYKMAGGAVISEFGDTSTICTAVNVTNELAEYHLKKDAENIRYFNAYPENWKERITPKKTIAYVEPVEVLEPTEKEPVKYTESAKEETKVRRGRPSKK